MATTSGREEIILFLVEEVESMGFFHVTRTNPTCADLGDFADTEFPVAAITAGLPQVVGHKQQRTAGGADVFLSKLEVVIFIWEQVNVDIDSKISDLADELWGKLWEDPTKGGLVIETENFFGEVPTWLRPYVTFNLTCRMTYQHNRGGI